MPHRLLLGLLLTATTALAQAPYFYPAAGAMNPAIPTPASYLGYQVGTWNVTHDQLVGYLRELDRVSDRISMREYGRTYEQRPMLCLTITAPENQARLEQIKAMRSRLVNPDSSRSLALKNLPAVNYMGYSIHGNETSGSNAALLMAYYLAAAQTMEVQQLLQNTIILFDPCFNPDGMQRFATWVNSRRSQHPSPDPVADEFNEPWPRGRYNHYFFDLNRDWLVAQQPETPGRIAIFQEWHPNVLTDHHEMGSNSTFFFQPGVPSRVNPITPVRNQELTAKIGQYHAKILSAHNVSFFTGENYDDFYYGKGSTYPDAQGCMGILFEQASSRGSMQNTDNGLLTFPYTIRNQVFTSLSTLQAVGEMRVELNEYLRDFYQSALEDARKDAVKGYLFADNRDLPGRELLNVLLRNNIKVKNLQENATVNGQTFTANNAFWVPCEQAQYRLVRAIFERPTTFRDSIFYDISAWTLPDAFGVDWTPVPDQDFNMRWVNAGDGVGLTSRYAPVIFSQPAYAYVVDAVGYELPKVLFDLQRAGVRVKVATKPFEADNQRFTAGSLIVLAENQALSDTVLMTTMNNWVTEIPVHPIYNGRANHGPDFGSESFQPLRLPKVLLLTGAGVNPESAGEVWHLLDTRYEMPVTMVESSRFGSVNLAEYNTLILPEGKYSSLSAERLRQFVTDGGTIVALGSALRWLKNADLLAIEFRKTPATAPSTRLAYAGLDENRSALRLPGSIFEAELDLTHPLCYGYERSRLPLFLGDTLFIAAPKNPYAAPVTFAEQPLLAGYIHPKQKSLLAKSAAIIVGGIGKGRIIGFAGNPNFRAFWYGTNRLFANAIFFGNVIDDEAVEKE
ncbi:MAG: M14 family metallopeptidase [Saprospiraceae bacterium]|nr:M14 family metallopeptidase [Saprospiraceae bacterium]